MTETILALQKTFDYRGRATRKEYWMFVLFYALLMIATQTVFYFIGGLFLSSIASSILTVLLMPTSLSLGARRLHDVGKSGWWQLLVLTGIGVLYILYLAIVPSDDGENTYGSPSVDGMTKNTMPTETVTPASTSGTNNAYVTTESVNTTENTTQV